MSKLTINEEEFFYKEGAFKTVVECLQKMLNEGWEDVVCEGTLYRSREENDDEYADRLAIEAREKERRRKQYEKLRKEFEE
jgi:hypothetical protein